MRTTRISILCTLMGCLLLPTSAWAGYFSPVAETPPPCLKPFDKASPMLYANGIQLRNMIANRVGPVVALPSENNRVTVSSFFDIYLEVSTDGGASWSDGVDHDCDSFFDIFTELSVDGGASGTQGCSQLDVTIVTLLGPLMIRESPTEPSGGRFTATPVGGGYMIDSFFDIFTEVSVDGVAWSPQTNGPTRMQGVPEPATLSLLALGALAVIRRRRR